MHLEHPTSRNDNVGTRPVWNSRMALPATGLPIIAGPAAAIQPLNTAAVFAPPANDSATPEGISSSRALHAASFDA
jgi:hypothetical protein